MQATESWGTHKETFDELTKECNRFGMHTVTFRHMLPPLSYHWSHRPGVCCMSFHKRGWDLSSFVAQGSPDPEVCSVVSECRDTTSPGLVSGGMADTGHDGRPAGTSELHSSTS